jgi:hypothetical protein
VLMRKPFFVALFAAVAALLLEVKIRFSNVRFFPKL